MAILKTHTGIVLAEINDDGEVDNVNWMIYKCGRNDTCKRCYFNTSCEAFNVKYGRYPFELELLEV